MSNVIEWLRERAEQAEQSGAAFANVHGRALRDAADAWEADDQLFAEPVQDDAAAPADAAP